MALKILWMVISGLRTFQSKWSEAAVISAQCGPKSFRPCPPPPYTFVDRTSRDKGNISTKVIIFHSHMVTAVDRFAFTIIVKVRTITKWHYRLWHYAIRVTHLFAFFFSNCIWPRPSCSSRARMWPGQNSSTEMSSSFASNGSFLRLIVARCLIIPGANADTSMSDPTC